MPTATAQLIGSHRRFDGLFRKPTPSRQRATGGPPRTLHGRALGHTSRTLVTSVPIIACDVMAMAGATLAIGFALSLLVEGYFQQMVWTSLVIPISFVCLQLLFGKYPGVGQGPIAELRECFLFSTTVFATLLVVLAQSAVDACFFTAAWLTSLVTTFFVRSIARQHLGRSRWWSQPAIILGDPEGSARLCESFENQPELGLRPIGIVEPECCDWTDSADGDEARPAGDEQAVFWAVVVTPESPTRSFLRLLARARRRFPHVLFVPATNQLPGLWNGPTTCGVPSAVHLIQHSLLPWPRLTKRAVDLVIATLSGLLLFPLILIVTITIRLSSRGPVLYSQRRLGRNGRHFHAWKFRTMVENADAHLAAHLAANPTLRAEWDADHKLKNDPRVTWIGRILRKSSIDELPQLWNVVKGDMSLVGPRPIVDSEVEKYGATYHLYRRVLPGITGLWQISGRNNTTYDQRVEFDAHYICNWSAWFDLYILLRTVKVVLFRDGAY